MPELALPVAVPVGVDPSSGYEAIIEPSTSGPGVFTGPSVSDFLVPSGEAWLVTSLYAEFRSLTATPLGWYLTLLEDPANARLNRMDVTVVAPAAGVNARCQCYGAIGIDTYADSSVSPATATSALPFHFGMPGWVYELVPVNNGGPNWTQTPVLHVTVFSYGGGGSSDGVQQSLAPFLYVPGPGADL